jgi:hypothetical protein
VQDAKTKVELLFFINNFKDFFEWFLTAVLCLGDAEEGAVGEKPVPHRPRHPCKAQVKR